MPAAIPLTDWGTRQQQLAAQLAAAQALKSKGPETNLGQMVSGHFVKTPWLTSMMPILDQLRGSMQEKRATQGMSDLNNQMQQDAANWIQSRPQQGPAMGPPDESGNMSQPNAPTMQDQLSWAMRGASNPLSKALASQFANDALIEAPRREADRQAKMELARQQGADKREVMMMQMQQRADELAQRAQDNQLNRDMRLQMLQESNALRRQIAQMSIDARLQAAQIGADARRDMAKLQPPKPVPDSVMKTLRGAYQQADNMNQVLSAFKPEYGGVGGMLSKTLGTWSPLSTQAQDDAANWWKQYQNQAALVERHEKFGTALSAGEQQAWRDATIAPGMTPQAIKHNLELRRNMAQKVFDATLQQYQNAGYPQVADAFQSFGQLQAAPQGQPQAAMPAPKGVSPSVIQELTRLLPPGAKYIGPAQ